jgi:hypothetical protein
MMLLLLKERVGLDPGWLCARRRRVINGVKLHVVLVHAPTVVTDG